MQINKEGEYERFVSPSFWFCAKNGLPTVVNSFVDGRRQVGKYAVPDQIKLKIL